MFMLIRLPLACFLLTAYAFFYYRTRKRLRTRTSMIFDLMVVMAMIHQLAAAVTEYTVNNRSTVSKSFNEIWHVIFFISLTGVCGLLCQYMVLYVERGTKTSKKGFKLFIIGICGVSIVGELFLPINYITSEQGAYSYGPKVFALYFMVLCIMVSMSVLLLRYKDALGKEEARVFLVSMGIFVVCGLIQIAYPHILMTSMAVTMFVLGIMLNTEDAHIYISSRTGMFNELGCKEILQELLITGKPFEIAVYVFQGDRNETIEVMKYIQSRLTDNKSSIICGAATDNVLVVMPTQRIKEIGRLPEKLPKPECSIKYEVEKMQFEDAKELSDIMGVVKEFKTRFDENEIKRDELTGLLRRAAFIQRVEYLIALRDEFTLFVLDVDDFKAVNETYGQATGDKVLCGVADALRLSLRASDVICRISGDTFAFVAACVTDKKELAVLEQRIIGNLAKIKALPDGQDINVSMGARICGKESYVTSFQEIYVEADNALYQAKRSGKARLSFSDETA